MSGGRRSVMAAVAVRRNGGGSAKGRLHAVTRRRDGGSGDSPTATGRRAVAVGQWGLADSRNVAAGADGTEPD